MGGTQNSVCFLFSTTPRNSAKKVEILDLVLCLEIWSSQELS